MKKLIVAIDPGVSGGIAIGSDSPVLHCMPETAHDLADIGAKAAYVDLPDGAMLINKTQQPHRA